MDEKELTLAGMDVPELLHRLMNNTALAKLLVGKFLEDKNFALLEAAAAQEDAAAMESASHTLKGMCGNMSLKELYGLFSQQVQLIRSGQVHQAAQMMDTIRPVFEKAAVHMKRWLSRQ